MTEQQAVTTNEANNIAQSNQVAFRSPYLSDVPKENFFLMNNGIGFGSLESMYAAIRNSDPKIFYFHVTNDRNDFANWIKACVKDEEFANRLMDIKQREIFLGVLSDEIAILKDPKIAKTAEFFKEDGDIGLNLAPVIPVVVSAPVVSAPLASPDSSPVTASNPAVNPVATVPIAPPITSPIIPPTTASDSIINDMIDDVVFDFEQVLKPLIDDINKEILSWD